MGNAATAAATGNWSSERIDALKALWERGASQSEAASELNRLPGGHLTRNAIAGKVARLQAAGIMPKTGTNHRVNARSYPCAPGERRSRKRASRAGRSRARAPRPMKAFHLAPPTIALPSRNLRIADLEADDCRFPTNNAAPREGHRFCAQPIEPGQVYCLAHCRIAYTPPVELLHG